MSAKDKPPTTIRISKQVIDFLCGNKSLNGVWFGEENERQLNMKPPRRYWWRQYLRPYKAKRKPK